MTCTPNADVPLCQLLISSISWNNNPTAPNLQTHFVASECMSVSLLGDSLCHIKHCFCCISTVGFPENDFFMWHTVSYIGRGLKCSKPHRLFEPSLSWEQWVFFFEAEAISFCVWQCNLGNRSAQSQQLGMVTNRILHEYLLNKSYEFMGLRQDSSLWFLALALWFFYWVSLNAGLFQQLGWV